MQQSELDNIFSYHAPKDQTQVELYATIRAHGLTFATFVNENTPKSAEQTLAIRSIQQAVMWANASVAIHSE
jgi:hypothetical protein